MIKIPAANIPQPKNGKWKEFNKYAILIAEGVYVNNQKHGTWKEYYDHTGTIMLEENFQQGVPHGRFTSYHPNGNVLSQGEFYNGLREGYFKVYNEEGKNIRNLLFINNIQIEDTNELADTGEKKAKTGS